MYKEADRHNNDNLNGDQIINQTKPIIKPSLLEIPKYKIKFVFDANAKAYNNLDTMELRPIELDSSIHFYNDKSKEGPLLPIPSITDIKIITQKKGILRKKQEQMIEISFDNKNNEKKNIKIIINEKQIDEFLDGLKIIQNSLTNKSSKATKKLNFKTKTGNIIPIKIKPMTPFLFQNEELVWKNIITNKDPKKKEKITLLNTITNYRVFQYDYINHEGKYIWINEITDIKIINIQQTSDLEIEDNHYKNKQINYMLTDSKSNSNTIVGDIEIISYSKQSLRFVNEKNPTKIKDLIESTRIQCNFSIDKDMYDIPEGQIIKSSTNQLKNDENLTVLNKEELICNKCNKKNSLISIYCIKCGQKLKKIIICKICNQSNVIDAVFCNMCGNKL